MVEDRWFGLMGALQRGEGKERKNRVEGIALQRGTSEGILLWKVEGKF